LRRSRVIIPDDVDEEPILVRADDAPILGDPGTRAPGLFAPPEVDDAQPT
jgi:hypothetical protein